MSGRTFAPFPGANEGVSSCVACVRNHMILETAGAAPTASWAPSPSAPRTSSPPHFRSRSARAWSFCLLAAGKALQKRSPVRGQSGLPGRRRADWPGHDEPRRFAGACVKREPSADRRHWCGRGDQGRSRPRNRRYDRGCGKPAGRMSITGRAPLVGQCGHDARSKTGGRATRGREEPA